VKEVLLNSCLHKKTDDEVEALLTLLSNVSRKTARYILMYVAIFGRCAGILTHELNNVANVQQPQVSSSLPVCYLTVLIFPSVKRGRSYLLCPLPLPKYPLP